MNRQKHIEERIELYLDDNLSKSEIEELWIDILQRPEYLDHLKINLSLRELHKRKKKTFPLVAQNYHLGILTMAALLLAVFYFTILNSITSPYKAPLTQIDLHEIQSPDVMRAVDGYLTGIDSLMHEAFNAAVMGENAQALNLYKNILNEASPENAVKAHFNTGIILYNEKQFGDAAKSFYAALTLRKNLPRVEEKARWYLGNTYANLDSLINARYTFYRTYQMNGVHKNEAREMLISIEGLLKKTP